MKSSLILYWFKLAFLVLIINPVYGQWVRKADEISKRAEGNNVVYQNKLYVFGGFGDNPIIEKTNEVYDIVNNQWSQIASFPTGKEITHNGIILVDDNVWIIGGRLVDAHGPVGSQVLIYNITRNVWSNGPELIDPSTGTSFPLGGGGYALVGRTLHVFGGFGPTICEDQEKLHLTLDIDKYLANPSQVTWENKLAPMPIPRNHLSYVVLGGKIYAFGGQFKHDCGAVDQKYCHVFDPLTNTWTRLTDLPIVRSHAEAATFAIDGKIYLVAGQGVNNITQNTVYQFDPKANNNLGAWTNLSAYKLPGSFLGLSSKLVGKSFIITNGALNTYSNERTETYIAQVTRSSLRTLGFTTSCLSKSLNTGGSFIASNLLYVIEDSVSYTITSDADWLKVTKNNKGTVGLSGADVEVAVNANGLAPGNYTGKITATGAVAGSSASFCVNLEVTDSSSNALITEIKSTTLNKYQLGELSVGTTYYTDRDYVIKTVPDSLNNMPFIKSACDDKFNTSANFLSFTLTQAATVYIAYDPRAKSLPSWLKGWQSSTDKLGIGDSKISYLNLYSKEFPAGQVTLGANLAAGAVGALAQYVVIAKAQSNLAQAGLKKVSLTKSTLAVKTIPVQGVGISNKSTEYNLKANKPILFPNPAHGNFKIIYPQSYKGASNLNITDINGKSKKIPLSLFKSDHNLIDLDVSSLSLDAGIYILKVISTDGKTDTFRVILK